MDDPSLVYIEWCAEEGECEHADCDHRFGIDGCVLDDRERWAQANLAMGRRISIDFLETERRSLPPAEFAREVLGWWDDPPESVLTWPVIDEAAWFGFCCDPDYKQQGPFSWALDVSPDAFSAAIAYSNGTLGALADYRAGTAWVVGRLHELGVAEVVLDIKGPAGSLLEDLDSAGIAYRAVTLQEHAQACGALLEDINDGVFRHLGQEPLDLAAEVADRRHVIDVWLWTRSKSAGDISPLVAVTLARWAASQSSPTADFFTL
jgi:hypothetical protein